jgi:hypothetical protein
MISKWEPATASTRRAAVRSLAVVLVAGALWACRGAGAAPDGGTVDYVGLVDATGAAVAVVADGRDVAAYVMDRGSATGERFDGVLVGDVARLRATDGSSMVLRIVGRTARGTVVPRAGAATTFTTTVVSGGPIHGLRPELAPRHRPGGESAGARSVDASLSQAHGQLGESPQHQSVAVTPT